MNICAHCGKEFVPEAYTPNQKYCPPRSGEKVSTCARSAGAAYRRMGKSARLSLPNPNAGKKAP